MKTRKTLSFLSGFGLAFLLIGSAVGGGIAPVEPTELLAAAPVVPEGWKKLVGRSQTLLSGSGVPVSIATRAYGFEIPVPDAPPKKVRVTINLQDQGGDFPLQDNVFGESAKMISVDGHSAAVLPLSETSTLLQLNIPPRLGLNITVEGVSNKEAVELLKVMDLTPYFSLSKRLPAKRYAQSQFILSVLDEMNPRNNGTRLQGVEESEPMKFDPPTAP